MEKLEVKLELVGFLECMASGRLTTRSYSAWDLPWETITSARLHVWPAKKTNQAKSYPDVDKSRQFFFC